MSSHGPTLVTCHCGQTLQVRDLWPHLKRHHNPAPDQEQQPFDYSTLEVPAQPKEEQ